MIFSDFIDFFNTVTGDNGLLRFVDADKSRKLYYLMNHMLEVNKSMNLTAIREEKAVITKHFVDSLTILPFLPQNAKILDVGCGAGFPCLPIGIFRPDLTITALDSTEKRIRYVQETAIALEIPNFTAIAARAEDLAHNSLHRERYDVVTARAVAALPVLSELCLPFVRLGGSFIAMKAKRGDVELDAARRGIKQLGGSISEARSITLKAGSEHDERLLISIEKITKTPEELPRAYAKIVKRPL